MDVRRELLARQIVLTGTVPVAAVRADIEVHFREAILPELELPGFRKGKAPRRLAEKRLHPNEMYKPVLDRYFAELVASVDGENVMAQGGFGFAGAMDGTEDVTLTCTVTLAPVVVSLDVEAAVASVTFVEPSVSSEEIEDEVLKRCQPHMLESVGRDEILSGCASAVIDFEGSINGRPFAGGQAADFVYRVGETEFVSGFEEQLLSLKVGETGCIAITFPANYPQKELAGMDAVFTVTVNSAVRSMSSKPAEDAAVSAGFKSLTALRQKVAEHLHGMKLYESEQAVRRAVLSAVSERAVCEMISNEALDAVAEASWHQFLERHGITEQSYTKRMSRFVEASKDAVRAKYGLDDISASGAAFDAVCFEEAVRGQGRMEIGQVGLSKVGHSSSCRA